MKAAILACLLVAGIFGCLLHADTGPDAACALQGTAMLTLVVFGTLLLDRRFLPLLARSRKLPAHAASFFHPPEVPA